MLTTTHAILNTTFLGRANKPERNWPLVLGAFFPDIPGSLYMMWKAIQWMKNGWSWDHSYYSTAWLPWVDWAHSIPLALFLLLLSLLFRSRPGLYFSMSMALHDLEDLLVHSKESHRHFLPFTDYRFISPVSCHELQYHAALMVPAEWALAVICCFWLWKRRPALWIKVGLVLVCVAQGLGVLYFLLTANKT